MNRTRLNLLLVVIVLALGAAAWVAKQQKDKPKATLTPLAALVPGDRVEVRGTRLTLVLVSDGVEVLSPRALTQFVQDW